MPPSACCPLPVSSLTVLQQQGTPGGAAAKEVARLSLHKLRDLQQELAAAEERAAAADHKSSALTASLAAVQEKLAAVHAEAASRAAEAAELSKSLLEAQARVAAEEQGRQEVSSQVAVSRGSTGMKMLKSCPARAGLQWASLSASCEQCALRMQPRLAICCWGRRWVHRVFCLVPHTEDPVPCCPLQALEAALAEARSEAAQLRVAAAASAERDAAAKLTPLQAGGGLAAAAVALPLLQLAYFAIRLVMWLLSALERVGVL